MSRSDSAFRLALSSWTIFYGSFSLFTSSCPRSDPRHRPACWSPKPPSLRATPSPRSSLKPSAPSASSNESASESAASVFNSFESVRLRHPVHHRAYSARARGPLGCAQPAHWLRHAPRAHGGRALCLGEHGVAGAGAVDSGTSWEEVDQDLEDLPRRTRDVPGGCVRADRVPHVRAATEHGPDELVVLTGTNHAAGEARWIRKERRRMLGGVDAQETAPPRRSHVAVNVGTDAGLLQRAFPPCLYEYMADDGGRVVLGNAGAGTEAERTAYTALQHQGADAVHHVDRPRGRRRAKYTLTWGSTVKICEEE
ncbi:hypothetical protein DFH09DRAFT_1083305 [Mycena vulgaris]|nr:hypothetical protein DFH09DRAFT_1083305 [Mycena vulgaris]